MRESTATELLLLFRAYLHRDFFMPKTHVGIRICPVRHLIGRRCKYNRKTVLAKGAQQVLYGGNNLLVDVVARERIAWPRPCIWYLAGFLRAANVDTI